MQDLHASILLHVTNQLSTMELVRVAACCKSLNNQIDIALGIETRIPCMREDLKAICWHLLQQEGYMIYISNHGSDATINKHLAYRLYLNKGYIFFQIMTIKTFKSDAFKIPLINGLTEFGTMFDKYVDSRARVYRGSKHSLPRDNKVEYEFARCAHVLYNSSRKLDSLKLSRQIYE